MRGGLLRALPGFLLGLTVATELAAVGLSWGLESRYDTLLYAVYSVTLAGAGALIASRDRGNAIGWMFCVFALLNAVAADLAQGWGLRAAERGWPAGPAAEWASTASWLPSGFGWILTFLLFPDGRLPNRRWRAVPWVGAVGMVLALPGWSLSPRRGSDFVSGHNPAAVTSLPTDALLAVGGTLYCLALLGAGLSLVVRFRASHGVERQQLKWFAFAAAVAGVVLPLSLALWELTPFVRVLAALALTALPVAACVAILRYRLYDIDLVINRTVVYGTVTVVLALAYGASTVLLGARLGRGSGWATAGATFVVTATFNPLRAHVQDAVDRRFSRARYDVRRRMQDFLEALRAGRAAPEGVEQALRDVLADPRLEVHFFLPESQLYVDARGAAVVDDPGDGRESIAVERDGQALGIVRYEPADRVEEGLVRTAVETGGLAIEIARLRVELRRQLAEVEASRSRIVQATNEERRRIERNLHDGAQQRLVSIGLALRHAQHEIGRSAPEVANHTLDGAVAEVAATIDELRELAHGLPPAQLDAGLAPAFRELARRAPLPVGVTASIERFDRGIEAAAYFIGCEGLTNAVKHANATRVDLRAARQHESLVVSVADDGVGGAVPTQGSGLSGLADRVAALGGTLRIESDPATGTMLTAKLPCGS